MASNDILNTNDREVAKMFIAWQLATAPSTDAHNGDELFDIYLARYERAYKAIEQAAKTEPRSARSSQG